MSNIDEAKVKTLLHQVVNDLGSMFEPNYYRMGVLDEIHAKIDRTSLLTTQAACATVKAQIEQELKP